MEIIGKMPSEHLRIGFDTDLTIRNVATLKALLEERFRERRHLGLELNPDAAVDLSFVQLVAAARSHLIRAGGELVLVEPASPRLRDVLQRAGFLEGASTGDLKFWLHSENAQ